MTRLNSKSGPERQRLLAVSSRNRRPPNGHTTVCSTASERVGAPVPPQRPKTVGSWTLVQVRELSVRLLRSRERRFESCWGRLYWSAKICAELAVVFSLTWMACAAMCAPMRPSATICGPDADQLFLITRPKVNSRSMGLVILKASVLRV